MSTSSELSESFSEMTSSDLRWFCWTEMSGGPSLEGAAFLSALLLGDMLSPCSDGVDSGCTAFFDVCTIIDCPVLSDKEVEGVSVSLDRSWGDSTDDRLVSGWSGTGVLAFLFPRSRLVREGLLSAESDVFSSSLLDVPAVLRGCVRRLRGGGGRIKLLSNGRV